MAGVSDGSRSSRGPVGMCTTAFGDKRSFMMFRALRFTILAAFITAIGLGSASAQVILDDPLQGSTSGTREGGTFVAGGWRVDNQYNAIYWHIPNVNKGAFEYDITGVGSNCASG